MLVRAIAKMPFSLSVRLSGTLVINI